MGGCTYALPCSHNLPKQSAFFSALCFFSCVLSAFLPSRFEKSSVKQCNNSVKFTKFMQNSEKWQILFGTQLTN